jgi:hypothetical protein
MGVKQRMGEASGQSPARPLADLMKTITVVLIAPSLVFVIVSSLVFVQRGLVNIDYFLLFLLFLPLGPLWATLALCALLCIDIIFAIAPAFHFSVASVVASATDLFALDPTYLLTESAKLATLVVLFGIAISQIAKSIDSKRTAVLTCGVLAILAVGLDQSFSLGSMKQEDLPFGNPNIANSTVNDVRIALATYNERAGITDQAAPINSASKTTGLFTGSGTDNERLVLVVVESLGEPVDPASARFLWEALDAIDALPHVTVERGSVPFEGSTVPGELRELCGVRMLVVHPSPEAISGLDCLPDRLRRQGYTSTAIHGFSGLLFSRNLWYPELRFDRVMFAPDLRDSHGFEERCGLAFSGVCDRDVWAAIVDELDANDSGKGFIYWLTLTAHLPTVAPTEAETAQCVKSGAAADSPKACALLTHHRRLFEAMAASVRSGGLRGTRILLVGDHSPPFLEAPVRSRFEASRVPWVDLIIH